MTPVDGSGEVGCEIEVVSTTQVLAAAPTITSLTVLREPLAVGVDITASYAYSGGKEGKTSFTWFQCGAGEVEDAWSWVSIPGASSKSYTPREEDAEKHICLTCTPVRSDGVVGEPITWISKDPLPS